MRLIDRPVPVLAFGGRTYYESTPASLIGGGVPLAVVLPIVRGLLKAEIDVAAEVERLRYITPGAGQAMEYQEAAAQAASALAAADPQPADYPRLAASIGFDVDPSTGKPAIDVKGVARSVDAAFAGFARIGAAIRGVRLSTKAAIDAADTIEAAQTVRDAVAWPRP